MIRIDRIIFGYVTFTISSEDIPTIAHRILKAGFSAKISDNGKIDVAYSKKNEFSELLSGIEYTVSDPKGFFGVIYRLRKRYGLIFAALISFLLLILSRTVVWDIRIDGIDGEEKDELISNLSASGLSVGSFWNKIDISSIEAKTLSSSESVAWLNVNRRGSVAYVTAVPKTVVDSNDKTGVYSNIVATRDCVVEKITVKRGIALVKVGETVKAGDVLISGVIPTELGGGVCYAEGSVIGRFSDRISHFSSKSVVEKVYSQPKIKEISIELFKKEINIFKTYRNLCESCDIIEKKHQLTLFGARLPIAVKTEEFLEYDKCEHRLDDGELVKRASEQLLLLVSEKTEDMTLISIKTDGDFSGSGYIMSAELIATGEVTKVIEFYRE